jgi:hypothetical protein
MHIPYLRGEGGREAALAIGTVVCSENHLMHAAIATKTLYTLCMTALATPVPLKLHLLPYRLQHKTLSKTIHRSYCTLACLFNPIGEPRCTHQLPTNRGFGLGFAGSPILPRASHTEFRVLCTTFALTAKEKSKLKAQEQAHKAANLGAGEARV